MEPRSTEQRIADVSKKLENDEDIWVASASDEGEPWLIPLSFSWDGAWVTVATLKHSKTARNLRRTGRARMALGPMRDVVILDGPVVELALEEDLALAEQHARSSFDPRNEPEEYVYIRMRVEKVQAYQNSTELANRVIMRAGKWLDSPN